MPSSRVETERTGGEVAGLLQEALQRTGSVFDPINGALEGFFGGVVQFLLVMPPTVFAILLGLGAWRGRRLAAGLVVVAGVHLITYVGAWDQAVRTVVGGLIAAVIAVAVTGAAALALRSWHRLAPVDQAARSLTVGPAVAISVALVGLAPLLSGPTFNGWILVSGLVAAAPLVAATDPAPRSEELRRNWLWNAVLVGSAARLLTELVAGGELGGLGALVRATATANTTDPVATVYAVLALVGFAAVLVALPGSGPQAGPVTVESGQEPDGTPSSGTAAPRGAS